MSSARLPAGTATRSRAVRVQAAVSTCTGRPYALGPPGRSPRVRHRMSTTRRIAFGTLARSIGEAAGKLASLVFFVVIARHLGEEQFGDFIFGMSLSSVLLLVAGLGMQE